MDGATDCHSADSIARATSVKDTTAAAMTRKVGSSTSAISRYSIRSKILQRFMLDPGLSFGFGGLHKPSLPGRIAHDPSGKRHPPR